MTTSLRWSTRRPTRRFALPLLSNLTRLRLQQLFMGGKLKLKGNMALAMKFEQVVKALEPKAKL